MGFYANVLTGADGIVRTGTTHGFVRDRDGFTKFDVPEVSSSLVNGINDRGEVVGEYGDLDAVPGRTIRSCGTRSMASCGTDAASMTALDVAFLRPARCRRHQGPW